MFVICLGVLCEILKIGITDTLGKNFFFLNVGSDRGKANIKY